MDIDIYTCRLGMGHYRAGRRIYDQLKSKYQPKIIDLYEELYPDYADLIYGVYREIVGAKGLFFKLFSLADGSKEEVLDNLEFLKRRFFRTLDKKPLPDLFIAAYSVAAYLLSKYIEERNLDIPLVTCITDFSAHELWINKNTALYLVATGRTKKELEDQGIPADRIIVYGLGGTMISGTGKGSNGNILISGGGLGILPRKASFYKALGKLDRFHFRILCGRNEQLRRTVEAVGAENLKAYPLVDEMEPFYRWADVLMSKAGGMSTSDAILAETPIVYFPPYLSWEKKNGAFIENAGIGTAYRSPEALTSFLLSGRPEQCRERMREVKADFEPGELPRRIEALTK